MFSQAGAHLQNEVIQLRYRFIMVVRTWLMLRGSPIMACLCCSAAKLLPNRSSATLKLRVKELHVARESQYAHPCLNP